MSGNSPLDQDEGGTVALTEVYPNLRVPVPGAGEWLDFFVAPKKSRASLYWRLSDGERSDPETVEFGFISSHKTVADAAAKQTWLERSAHMLGLPT